MTSNFDDILQPERSLATSPLQPPSLRGAQPPPSLRGAQRRSNLLQTSRRSGDCFATLAMTKDFVHGEGRNVPSRHCEERSDEAISGRLAPRPRNGPPEISLPVSGATVKDCFATLAMTPNPTLAMTPNPALAMLPGRASCCTATRPEFRYGD